MFEKLNSFSKKVADLDNRPALNPADLKAHFDAAPDEVRQYLNKLIDALKKTEAGDSGAKNVGVTTISGLTGNDVQTVLESVVITSGSNVYGRYAKYPDGTLICSSGIFAAAGTGLKVVADVTYPMAFVGEPNVILTHRSIAGRFANFYVFNPTAVNFSIYHQGVSNVDLDGTIFTWVAIGRWK